MQPAGEHELVVQELAVQLRADLNEVVLLPAAQAMKVINELSGPLTCGQVRNPPFQSYVHVEQRHLDLRELRSVQCRGCLHPQRSLQIYRIVLQMGDDQQWQREHEDGGEEQAHAGGVESTSSHTNG
jgi:hypothetical protein